MQVRKKCHRYLWLLSGTGEGPLLAKAFIEKGWNVSVSVVSYQASLAYSDLMLEELFIGSLDGVQGICSVLNKAKEKHNGFACVIDATHPFAIVISENLRIACEKLQQEFIRYERPRELVDEARSIKNFKEFSNFNLQGEKLLLAIGSRFLPEAFSCIQQAGADVFARVLPSVDGLLKAFSSEIPKQNIAVVRPLQGAPEGGIELALCRRWGITGIVCRESGGLNQKVWQSISHNQKIDLWLLARPPIFSGVKTLRKINDLLDYLALKHS